VVGSSAAGEAGCSVEGSAVETAGAGSSGSEMGCLT